MKTIASNFRKLNPIKFRELNKSYNLLSYSALTPVLVLTFPVPPPPLAKLLQEEQEHKLFFPLRSLQHRQDCLLGVCLFSLLEYHLVIES